MPQDDLSDFERALDWYPPAYWGNRLNLLLLADAEPLVDPRDYLRRLDQPNLVGEAREFSIEPELAWPFPTFRVDTRPSAQQVQLQLADGVERAKRFLPTQRDLAGMISAQATLLHPDVVALMVVDGLSYYDLDEASAAQPIIVDGVTITDHGYRQVIGSPPVSARLFRAGYMDQRGYSFFDRKANDLAADLFHPFADIQLTRVRQFAEVLADLEARPVTHTYVQVTSPGLDGICHQHPDAPPVQYYLQSLLQKFTKLVECLSARHSSVLAFLTSDHGILWREGFEPGTWRIASGLAPEDCIRGRYVRGAIMRDYTVVVQGDGSTYSLLKYPYLARDWRSNEWGMHGGISAWESIVPLITRFTG